MDTSLLIEIAGLEAVHRMIGERLKELRNNVEGKREPEPARVLVLPPAPVQKVVSQAKLDALKKARAAKKKAARK